MMSGGRASEFVNCEMFAGAGACDVGPPSRTPALNPRISPLPPPTLSSLLALTLPPIYLLAQRPVSYMRLRSEQSVAFKLIRISRVLFLSPDLFQEQRIGDCTVRSTTCFTSPNQYHVALLPNPLRGITLVTIIDSSSAHHKTQGSDLSQYDP